MISRIREQHGISFLPLTDGGQDVVPHEIESLCLQLSGGGKLAYVEAEFFGGVGTQACALYENGQAIGHLEISPEAINHSLNFLGVFKEGDSDEFEALSLDKHRDIEDWLNG